MAYKGVGGGRGGGQRSGTPGGRGKGRQGGPRQPLGRKEGRAGAKRQGPVKQERPVAGFRGQGPARPKPEQHKERYGHAADRAGGQGGFSGQEPLADKVLGINPVLELMKSGGRPVDALYIDREKGGKQFGEIIGLARRAGINLKVVPREALDKLSGGLRHQGVIAAVAAKEYADFHDMVARSKEKGGVPLIVVLDGVEDPQNLGSVIRTAESAGADGVVIPEHRAVHLTAAVARASAGALEHMPVAKVTNMAEALIGLKEKGFWVVGLEGGSGMDYTGFDMKVPLAVVLGSEGRGIRPVVRKNCDSIVSLPMHGKVNSLNVSVAAGVILYEVLRQRFESKK